MLSAAGPTAGRSLIAQLNTAGAGYADESFRYALHWRLGLLPPVQQACMNVHIGDGDTPCSELLGTGSAHEVDCPVGPLSIQRHSFLAETWCRIAQSCGCLARREVLVPEFTDTK